MKCILHRKPDNRLIQVKVDATEAAQRFLTDDLQEDLRRAILDVVEADLFGHQLRQKSLPEAAPSGGLVLEVGRAPCGIWDKFRCAQNDQTLTLQVQKFDFLLRRANATLASPKKRRREHDRPVVAPGSSRPRAAVEKPRRHASPRNLPRGSRARSTRPKAAVKAKRSPAQQTVRNSRLPSATGRTYSRWGAEEVGFLHEGVKKFGIGSWARILAAFPFDTARTAVHLKDKWRNLEMAKQNQR